MIQAHRTPHINVAIFRHFRQSQRPVYMSLLLDLNRFFLWIMLKPPWPCATRSEHYQPNLKRWQH